MPSAVPGLGSPTLPGLSGPGMPGAVASPMGFGAAGDPTSAQYVAVTQADGSILLHIKNADGSLGPAVKIVNPIKPKTV